MRASIPDQLSEALAEHEWTVGELLRRSGLKIRRSALQRKLRGQLRLNVDEAVALADAFGMAITVSPKKRKRAA